MCSRLAFAKLYFSWSLFKNQSLFFIFCSLLLFYCYLQTTFKYRGRSRKLWNCRMCTTVEIYELLSRLFLFGLVFPLRVLCVWIQAARVSVISWGGWGTGRQLTGPEVVYLFPNPKKVAERELETLKSNENRTGRETARIWQEVAEAQELKVHTEGGWWLTGSRSDDEKSGTGVTREKKQENKDV